MKIQPLEDTSITRRPDLRNHDDLQIDRPPPVGVCVESAVFQYDGTNIVQWWIAKNGVWNAYKRPFVIKG